MVKSRHKIGTVDEFSEDGSRITEEVNGREIVVFRKGDEYFALLDFCVHQGGPISDGMLQGQMVIGKDEWEWEWDEETQVITCPWHSWKYDITSGENIDCNKYQLPTFKTEVEDGEVFVIM